MAQYIDGMGKKLDKVDELKDMYINSKHIQKHVVYPKKLDKVDELKDMYKIANIFKSM